jgi:hypothetical protein
LRPEPLASASRICKSGLGQATLAELDGAKAYSNATHTRGDNASALIFAATR